MQFFRQWHKSLQSFKKIQLKLSEKLGSQDTKWLYAFVAVRPKMTRFKLQKSEKNSSENYIQKSCTHIQTLKKTLAKFQKDPAKNVGGVAFIRLNTFCDGQQDRHAGGRTDRHTHEDKTKCHSTLTGEALFNFHHCYGSKNGHKIVKNRILETFDRDIQTENKQIPNRYLTHHKNNQGTQQLC